MSHQFEFSPAQLQQQQYQNSQTFKPSHVYTQPKLADNFGEVNSEEKQMVQPINLVEQSPQMKLPQSDLQLSQYTQFSKKQEVPLYSLQQSQFQNQQQPFQQQQGLSGLMSQLSPTQKETIFKMAQQTNRLDKQNRDSLNKSKHMQAGGLYNVKSASRLPQDTLGSYNELNTNQSWFDSLIGKAEENLRILREEKKILQYMTDKRSSYIQKHAQWSNEIQQEKQKLQKMQMIEKQQQVREEVQQGVAQIRQRIDEINDNIQDIGGLQAIFQTQSEQGPAQAQMQAQMYMQPQFQQQPQQQLQFSQMASNLDHKYNELIKQLNQDLNNFVEQRKMHDDKDDLHFKEKAKLLYTTNQSVETHLKSTADQIAVLNKLISGDLSSILSQLTQQSSFSEHVLFLVEDSYFLVKKLAYIKDTTVKDLQVKLSTLKDQVREKMQSFLQQSKAGSVELKQNAYLQAFESHAYKLLMQIQQAKKEVKHCREDVFRQIFLSIRLKQARKTLYLVSQLKDDTIHTLAFIKYLQEHMMPDVQEAQRLIQSGKTVSTRLNGYMSAAKMDRYQLSESFRESNDLQQVMNQHIVHFTKLLQTQNFHWLTQEYEFYIQRMNDTICSYFNHDNLERIKFYNDTLDIIEYEQLADICRELEFKLNQNVIHKGDIDGVIKQPCSQFIKFVKIFSIYLDKLLVWHKGVARARNVGESDKNTCKAIITEFLDRISKWYQLCSQDFNKNKKTNQNVDLLKTIQQVLNAFSTQVTGSQKQAFTFLNQSSSINTNLERIAEEEEVKRQPIMNQGGVGAGGDKFKAGTGTIVGGTGGVAGGTTGTVVGGTEPQQKGQQQQQGAEQTQNKS